MNTAQLIDACRAGDPVAVETLVRAHEGRVYRLALALLGEPQEAEEAAQDALVIALQGLERFRGEAAFSTWLSGITINVCRRRRRWRRARERLQAALQAVFVVRGPLPAPEEYAIAAEGRARLWALVQRLDEKVRVPVVLRYAYDMSNAEIARVLGIPAGTVDSRLYTARERLRQWLGGAPEELEELPDG